MKINYKILDEEAIPPKSMHEGDAGSDLHSLEEKTLQPGDYALFKTGIAVEIPIGYMGKVAPRSGLALNHGVTVLNAEGTIDSGYRGDVGVILINHGDEPYTVEKGERIAQLVIEKHERVQWVQKDELQDSKRKDSGFGDSGKFSMENQESGRISN